MLGHHILVIVIDPLYHVCPHQQEHVSILASSLGCLTFAVQKFGTFIYFSLLIFAQNIITQLVY